MITTREELNALPEGTVILDRDAVVFQRQAGVWEPICAGDRENLLGSEAVPAVVVEQPAPEPEPVKINHTRSTWELRLAAARAETMRLREKLVWQEAEIARLIIDRDQARQENAQVMPDYTDQPIRSRSDNAFNTYQEKTAQTAIYSEDLALEYLIPGLAAEAGEVAGKWAKIIRDQGSAYDQADADAIIKEVGDVLWMIARIAAELGVSLDVVAERNLQKLADRKKRGVLGGSGDHR